MICGDLMIKELSESEIKKVNEIVRTLQKDLDMVIDHAKRQEFNESLREIVNAMGHTSCPVCKEKLANLSTKILDAKKSCNNKDGNCKFILKEVVDNANTIKNEFVPIATEKKFIKDKNRAFKLPEFPFPDPLGLFKRR